ncbi:dTDP-4-dehydrorhamnose 3,5-epimerase [Crocosphaera sp. XPORK-15E]|uniref:dTDP-4-dehydrorhamnose 3,5-epimerase n=1 Tax=Crocosphaera sp. XPORK-15E TaxID=3110247 RepID=UPI002B217A56|nr:dTDP-4-dehydrorhamnose 3,5-epimerase [Crocosphaera sp. XPORK-15E]MEA5536968.1 dTDP-4-dehydrorhamnose 3,5-epimerase [Crocosphaera sp. XPORK-15E]
MGLINQVEFVKLERFKDESLSRFGPVLSNETVVYEIPPKNTDDGLFCHRFQTDKLFVIRGTLVLVFIQNRDHHYVLMTQENPLLVIIPPGIPHAVMNPTSDSCFYINAVIRHGKPHNKDYKPIQKPFTFNQLKVNKLMGLYPHFSQIDLKPQFRDEK